MKTYPLSQVQTGIYLDCRQHPQATQYNQTCWAQLPVSLDLARLEAALGNLVRSRAVLRTRFAEDDAGEVRQYADPDMTIPVTRLRVAEAEVEATRARLTRPFDLTDGSPLVRFAFVETEAHAYFFADIHHLIMDGYAICEMLFTRDLRAAYAGQPLVADDLGLYTAAEAEAQFLAEQDLSAHKARYADLFDGLSLATLARNASADALGPEAQEVATVPRADCDAWCATHNVKVSALFQTAFALVLARLLRQDRIAFTTVHHGRLTPSAKSCYGMFVRQVPVVASLGPTVRVADALAASRTAIADFRAHADYPFTALCSDLQLTPGAVFNFICRDSLREVMDFNGMLVPFVRPRPTASADDLHVDVCNMDADYEIRAISSIVKHDTATLKIVANAVRAVVLNLMAHPDAMLKDIALVTNDEAAALVKLGTGAALEYDHNETVVDLFKKHAQATPEVPAVVAANGTLTYGELDAQSDALAATLVANGVVPNDFVAVKLGRVKEFPLAVIAIWKAGAAYVPIDPEYPEDRIAYMLEDSRAKVVIDEAFVDEVRSKKEEGKSVEFSSSSDSSFLPLPSSLSYMIYTSGSTGKPKGVMVSHANLRAFLAWLPDELELKPGEAVAEHASFSFDASICDLYTSLSRGVTLHILSSELRKDLDGLAQYLVDNRIVGATLSTQLGMELLNACDLKLRYMVLGGEKLKHVKKTSVRLYNGYGPTEFTCWSSHHVVDQANDGEDIPIGRAVPNTLSAIVDTTGNLLPRGCMGELVLAGDQLSRGYWQRPELTAERFVSMPWLDAAARAGRAPYQRGDVRFDVASECDDAGRARAPLASDRPLAYRTGDLARWNEDGELVYGGRIDNQVKLRGFRIEMGEIESAIAKFPGVTEAAAEVKTVNGTPHLVGYFVATTSVDVEQLRASLEKSLTAYMVPDAFVQMEKFPLTPNGKVNRKALPIPEILGAAYVAPQGTTETIVAQAMVDVLALDTPVGRDDNFLSLGGDSIKSIRLVSKLRAAGVTVTVADIMQAKTVKGIAVCARTEETLVTDQSAWSGDVPLTAIQATFFDEWKLPRAAHFNQSQILSASTHLDADRLKRALDSLARHHDMLRAVYANGVQHVRAVEGEGALCELAVVEGDDEATIAARAEATQASFDLANGPLFKAVLFQGAQADHLLLVIHHLVVDGVSWRILLEDLETAYGQLAAGSAVKLPPKTMSFRDWCAAVGRYAESSTLRRECAYWQEVDAQVVALPHTTARGPEVRELMRTLSAQPFAALTGASARAYHTEGNDLLLTAIARAFAQVKGETVLSVELEGHGREPLHTETQIDRTVGWFTSAYPVILATTDDLRTSIRAVKETLRRVPNHGLGYGILRHVAKGVFETAEPVPAMSFNYLGSFSEGGGRGVFALDGSMPHGRDSAAENVFGPALAVNCWGTPEGTLAIAFACDASVWSDADAAAFADAFVRELEAVVAHTLAVRTPERTASDLGEIVWTDAEFQSVESAFAPRSETLERIYPLLPMQEAMLLSAVSHPASSVYHLASRVALNILPDRQALERAVTQLLEKHEVLRTAIVHEDVSEPRQVLVRGRALPVSFVDLSGEPDVEVAAVAFEKNEFARAIDLQCDPLFRVVCLQMSATTCQLLFVVHHIIVDGWCIALYLNDLAQFLRAEIDGTAQALTDFAAHAGRYERHVRSVLARDRQAALSYWHGLLEGYETKAEVPSYATVADADRAASNELSIDLSRETTARLTEVCRTAGCTLNNVVEAAWGLLLQKCTRMDDVVFVKVVSGRDHATEEAANTVGLFINSVPVRVRTVPDMSLLDLVKAQQRQAGETSAHDWAPLSDIQRESALGQDLFQSIIAFENYETGDDVSAPLGMRVLSARETNVAELALAVRLGGDRLNINLKFDIGKYTLLEMTRLVKAFECLLGAFAESPDQKSVGVSLLDEADVAEVLALGTGAALEYDHNETVIDLFKKHAQATPEVPAVVDANGTLTYGELDAQSDVLAATLVEKGVEPHDFVAVKLGRVKEFPLAVIAIWKAGAAYVPIDPEYPEERIAYMLEDSNAKVVIDIDFLDEVRRKKEEGKSVEFSSSSDSSSFLPLTSSFTQPSSFLPLTSSLAYMIYTSGSTGKPKGAMVTHANLRAFLAWLSNELALKPGEAIAEHASFSFDASICDLYTSLTCGVTLHILSSELRKDLDGLAQYLADNRIVGATLSTQMGMELLNACDLTLRYMVLGGEKLKHVKKTSVRLYNAYGPTEFTCVSSYHVVDQANDGEDIPIGRAVPNTLSAIVDAAGNLLPRGFMGELVLAGDQLGRGYWQRPELTAERFVPMSWLDAARAGRAPYQCGDVRFNVASECDDAGRARAPLASERSLAYRTGDLARWNEDGELVYGGRIDNQVKLRGFRIEMGEIESAIAKFPGITEAAAEVKTINGTPHLVGYFAATAPIDVEQLCASLEKTLTAYMVPDAFVQMEKFPLTPNGKVNRKALPIPEIKAEEIVPPANEDERKLFAVVAAELKTEDFGVTTNLIMMGLTSLKAIRLSAAIRKATDRVIPTGEILAKPRIRDWVDTTGVEETIPVLPPREAYPLTENQLGVYLDWDRNRDGLQYNVPTALRFAGYEAAKLHAAVLAAVAAHPVFKTHLELRDNAVVQIRRDDATLDVSLTSLDHEPDAAFFQTRVKPFDLLADDLARIEVVAAPASAYLFFDVHHIIFDGGAADVFLRAVLDALAGATPASEQATAFDFALACADWMKSDRCAAAERYFAALVSETESLAYPAARSNASVSGALGTCVVRVPRAAIQDRCRQRGWTENAFFATAFCETLRRLARTDDVQIVTISNGRSFAQLANTVGMFVQTLPLVSRAEKIAVTDALAVMQKQIAATLSHDRYPFTKLVERHGLKPHILYGFQGGVMDAASVPYELIPLALDTAKMPLALNVYPKGDAYELAFEYDAGLYAAEEIQTLGDALNGLAQALAEAGNEMQLASVPMVTGAAAQELIALGTGPTLAYNHEETVLDLFRQQVAARPGAPAVVAENGTLTYAELDAQSTALAAVLIEHGVAPNDFVAIKLGRVKEFPLAVIAIWKAGAAYVPVDPEYPEDRIAYMIEDSGAKVVIDEKFVDEVRSKKEEGKSVEFSSPSDTSSFLPLPSSFTQSSSSNTFSFFPLPSYLSYMIYTSGSTGKPKGVMVTHANLRAFLAWRLELTGAKAGEAFAHYTSFGFDASMDDLATPLAAGACLHILPESIRLDLDGLRRYLADHAIVGLTLPTQFGMQLLNGEVPSSLRYLMVGGEKLKPTKVTSVQIVNGYGPTEFTVCSSYHIVDPARDGEDIPIGRAVPNTLSAIVDEAGNLLPRGCVGELVLAGAQLTNGYWHRPELTAERFVPLPWLDAKAYRTGDLARWNADGELVYCGRIDNQVKLRGFRIEMGEIETTLAKFPGVTEAAAEVKTINGAPHLVGYYVSSCLVDEEMLRATMAQTLTDYMVPDAFVRMESFPLTPNGKVNRKALPTPDAAVFAGEYVEPETDVERTLCAAYGRILNLEHYGATMDFFRAGGTSLSGIRLVAELQRLGFTVVYGDVFRYQTPRALAQFLASAQQGTVAPAAYKFDDFDYTAIDAMLGKTPTEPLAGGELQPLGNVLLTGVTGYLGIHVLRQLVEKTDAHVTLLVRPKGSLTVEKRVNIDYVYYFGETLTGAACDRVSFVAGDITDGDLATKLEGVAFDTLINCAALVKHYVADDLMDRVNVVGVQNLIDLCSARGARLVQTSTYSIGGVASAGTQLDERHLFVGQTSDNDYIRTKFTAERIVLDAVAAGRLRGKVMRLGNLMGRESDGEFQINVYANAFVNSLKTAALIGMYPMAGLADPIEFSPIDRVAEAVVKLASTPDDMVVFHPFSAYHTDIGTVLDVLNELGHPIAYVSQAEYAARVAELRADPERAKDLQGILHYGSRLAPGQAPVGPSNVWTTVVLRRLGFRWNPPDAGYLRTFLKILEGMQVFG